MTKMIHHWRSIIICSCVIIVAAFAWQSYAKTVVVAGTPCYTYYGDKTPYDATKINGEYVLPWPMQLVGQYTTPSENRGIHTGDVNGDGLEDFVLSYSDPNDSCNLQKVYINNGQGKWDVDARYNIPIYFTAQYCIGGNLPVGNDGVMMFDVNNDGYTDIYQYTTRYDHSTKASGIFIYLNKTDGTGWEYNKFYSDNFPVNLLLIGPCHTEPDNGIPFTNVARTFDVNGDGLFDLIRSTQKGSTDQPVYGSEIYINKGGGVWSEKYGYSQ